MSPEATATREMVSQWTKKRELTNKDQMKGVTMLIGQVKKGDLPYVLISIVTKNLA